MEVQPRQNGEYIGGIRSGSVTGSTSTNPAFPKRVAMLDNKPPADRSSWGEVYIPENYPYTHTHIKDLGDWPQRLLHVPTMTSFEWQPGNIYGGHHEPKYRAISYTWGRWRLKDDAEPATKALTIHDVPWKVPRVKTQHFSAQQFQDIINRACEPVKAENAIDMAANSNLLRGLPQAEFVWLDVACIDQRWGPLAAMEVGRQAGIFRKSNAVAIWLSQSGKDTAGLGDLETVFTDLICHVEDSFYTSEGPDIALLTSIAAGLGEVFADPWFTSLWTLQEAYLSQDAYLISSEGRPLRINPTFRWTPGVFTLNLLTDACRKLSYLCESNPRGSETPEMFGLLTKLRNAVHKSGLSLLTRNANPLSLLSAAHWRETSDPLDRVYGIMQVFGYRLGAASPDSDPSRSYTQQELVDELGAALFQDRSVQSQLHSFTEIVERSQGWHVNTSSAVPDEFLRDNDWKRSEARCRFSTRVIEGVTFGHFSGRICVFSELAAAWEAVDKQSAAWRARTRRPGQSSVCRIFPDMTEYLTQYLIDMEENQDSSAFSNPLMGSGTLQSAIRFGDDPEDQHPFAQWLSNRFADNRLFVLIMGRLAAKTCGLIILHVKVGSVLYWHRLGTCTWWHDSASLFTRGYYEILGGDSEGWADAEGLFG